MPEQAEKLRHYIAKRQSVGSYAPNVWTFVIERSHEGRTIAVLMTRLLQRYFSFDGRLARLPFFIRTLYLNIGWGGLIFAQMPLFLSDSRVLWWLGVFGVLASLVIFATGLASMFVRRLHDLGFSGY